MAVAQIEPLEQDELPDLEGLFGAYEQIMGLVPTTVLTMARMPGLVQAYAGMALPAAMNGLIGEDLAQLCANVTSAAAGCRYCQAHTVAHAEHLGVPAAKLDELWSWDTSDHFTDAERSALTLAYHAGMHPNAVTDADFASARRHFDDDQLTAIVAVCSLFGFLNRWNDTVATELEAVPLASAERHLASRGWEPGKHAATPPPS
jgi:alkylhydroperoxidase family enzyme